MFSQARLARKCGGCKEKTSIHHYKSFNRKRSERKHHDVKIIKMLPGQKLKCICYVVDPDESESHEMMSDKEDFFKFLFLIFDYYFQ